MKKTRKSIRVSAQEPKPIRPRTQSGRVPDEARIHKELQNLVGQAESLFDDVLMALVDRNVAMAIQVIEKHIEMRAQQVVFDNVCMRMMPGLEPGKSSQRMLAAIQIRSELARIGDLTRDIAMEVLNLTRRKSIITSVDFSRLIEWVEGMMRDACRAVIDVNSNIARSMLPVEPVVDDECHRVVGDLLKLVQSNTDLGARAVSLIGIAQHLRTIAHCATDISAAVIFLKEGRLLEVDYDYPFSSEELAGLREEIRG